MSKPNYTSSPKRPSGPKNANQRKDSSFSRDSAHKGDRNRQRNHDRSHTPSRATKHDEWRDFDRDESKYASRDSTRQRPNDRDRAHNAGYSSRPSAGRRPHDASKPFAGQQRGGRQQDNKQNDNQWDDKRFDKNYAESHEDQKHWGSSHEPSHRFEGAEQSGPSEAPLLLGVKPVLEMLATTPERIDAIFIRKGRHGKEMDEILDLCRKGKVRFSLLEPANFARQLGQTQTQGVVARLFEAGFTPLEALFDTVMDAPLPLLVALDQVQDPGNAGTLARTLYSLGGAGLIIPRHNSVYLGAGATRAAAGALQKLPVARVGSLTQAIDAAKKLGITIYGAAASDDTVPVADIFSLTPRLPALLILGSEESGIRQTLIKRCDTLVSIPMQRDFDSLNVAQAGAICIASFLRHKLQRS